MNYAAVKKTDVANGPGVRVSLFVSGCTHGCKGCFNAEAWDFNYGQEYTQVTEEEILRALAPSYIRGLSVLGGEPMEPQNRGTVLSLLRRVRGCFPQKDIWCYTGYDYESDLLRWVREERNCRDAGRVDPAGKADNTDLAGRTESAERTAWSGNAPQGEVTELLSLIDVLVDGEFVEAHKNLRLAFRGSENQRLIDVRESLRQGRTVCLQEGEVSG